MKKEELDRLLEKYYKGETTEREDNILMTFFNGVHIPAGYEAEKTIFGYYSAYLNIQEPSIDFESRIMNGIDEFERRQRLKKTRNTALIFMSAAAGLILMVGSYFFFSNRDELQDTFTDPQIAYNETIKILMNVSSRLNNATRTLEPVGMINDVKSKNIEKNLKNLEYIQTAIDLTRVSVDKK